ncbi:hypothetical protein QT711_13475 [Sporosarcina saromensis]|uniref:DUF4064 domain-containing protein n=1 Tax=Sporosarcina saromensis TaxID=359365 RepID=A0ABU4GB27_9BACL|nr:hypothetical protein [Sporosarcina saromensis]MDW0114201.1 hypothetical protein [Sporosarcina saromensis]
MIIIETVVKVQRGNKKEWWILIVTLLALLLFFLLTHFLSIYPGGYSFDKQSGEVLIGKGADIQRVALSTNNELKIALLESEIIYLKTLWYVGLLFTATCLIGTLTFRRLKLKKVILLTASIYVVLAILLSISYANTLFSIESLINNLIK